MAKKSSCKISAVLGVVSFSDSLGYNLHVFFLVDTAQS